VDRYGHRWADGLGAHLVESLLEAAVEAVEGRFGLVEGDVAAPDQDLGCRAAHRALGVDELVHEGLRVARVVAFVVAVAP